VPSVVAIEDALVPPLAIGTTPDKATVAVPPKETGEPVTVIFCPFDKVIDEFDRAAFGTAPKEGSAPVLPRSTVLVAPTATDDKLLVALPICTEWLVVPDTFTIGAEAVPVMVILLPPVTESTGAPPERETVTVEPEPVVATPVPPIMLRVFEEGVAVPALVTKFVTGVFMVSVDPDPDVEVIPLPVTRNVSATGTATPLSATKLGDDPVLLARTHTAILSSTEAKKNTSSEAVLTHSVPSNALSSIVGFRLAIMGSCTSIRGSESP
jgi:hypothetical protein